ncbi:MAG: phosphoribosylamine--glycine ligase [Gemmatimonadales bacterium]
MVGSGGREHALCWTLAQGATVWCAPGNPGTATVATNLPIPPDHPASLIDAVRTHRLDAVIIGPEGPLADGLADHLVAAGIPVFGPSAAAAQIEASKAWAKALMHEAGIPTARSATFTNAPAARSYIDAHAEPLVVKASGLAAGKGAVVCATRAEARSAADAMFDGRFGDAGREVVIESFLEGEELSVFALTDGEQIQLLPPAQDHKRLGEGDTGPNTGGMGAYTPVSLATPALLDRAVAQVIRPTLAAMADRGARYRGVLYAGLMVAPDGRPSVIEFNCRFGDPEAQVVLPVADLDLAATLVAIARDDWRPTSPVVRARRAAVTTILAAPGYPETPEKGVAITLPATLPAESVLFHAGTRVEGGRLVTAGGRVLCATGFGVDVPTAAQASRALAELVTFDGAQWRRDIGWRELAR